MINKENQRMGPGSALSERHAVDQRRTAITDAARGKTFSNFMMAMALLKNYQPFEGPKGLTLGALFKKFDKTWALTKKSTVKYGPHVPRSQDR